jgi:hypothetical protein
MNIFHRDKAGKSRTYFCIVLMHSVDKQKGSIFRAILNVSTIMKNLWPILLLPGLMIIKKKLPIGNTV